jgi:uncharacterized OB-fold protein
MPLSAPNDRLSARFFEAASSGRLSLPLCATCGKHHLYPRPFCPYCWSEDLNWVDASGDANIYSFTVIRGGEPYVLAVVELAEGPRMMTNIVDCHLDAVQVGMRVRVDFRPLDGIVVPVFRPSAGGIPRESTSEASSV